VIELRECEPFHKPIIFDRKLEASYDAIPIFHSEIQFRTPSNPPFFLLPLPVNNNK
jgi:hypothetical protein